MRRLPDETQRRQAGVSSMGRCDLVTDTRLALPVDITEWIEGVTGQTVTSADRIPGGATREGWFVDVGVAGGATRELFLRYSPQPLPERSAFHHLGTEAAIMRALGPTEVAVPTILGVHPQREAVLSERVRGATWFYRIKDSREQLRVAQDFIRNMAALHVLEPKALRIEALGPVRSVRQHALERIEGIRWRGTAPDGSMDPLLRLSTDWLERNVPDYDGPAVLVQGDTGPGNFMYADHRVTAVVDWSWPIGVLPWTTWRGCRCAPCRTPSPTCPTGWRSTPRCRGTRSTSPGCGISGCSPSRR